MCLLLLSNGKCEIYKDNKMKSYKNDPLCLIVEADHFHGNFICLINMKTIFLINFNRRVDENRLPMSREVTLVKPH